MSYNVGFTITNNTKTQLNYNLYKSTSAPDLESSSCTLKSDTDTPNETHYYYICSGSNNYGASIKSGNVDAVVESDPVTITESAEDTIDTSEVSNVYYYLVVEYKNGENQNEDMGKQISLKITGITNVKAVQKTA